MNAFQSKSKKTGLFVTAGFPELNSTNNWIREVQKAGFDFIEIGMPFSDPLADGPVIQNSSEIALYNGMNMRLLFEQLLEVKSEIKIPIVLMGYLNPVLQFGLENFLEQCKNSGIAHVILPDMSVELYERFYKSSFDKFGISNCFLITTQTPQSVLDKVKAYSSNSFIYLVSSNSTTGDKGRFQLTNEQRIGELRDFFSPIPLFIGFGIRNKTDLQVVHEIADGAIIGSAFIQAILQKKESDFLKELLN